MNNKKTSTIITALLIGILVSGCGGLRPTHNELNYLSAVKSYNNQTISENTDEKLIELGNLTCTLFDNNETPTTVIVEIVKAGNFGETPNAMSYVIIEAIRNICPKYTKYLAAG